MKLLLFVVFCVLGCLAIPRHASVYYNQGVWSINEGKDDNAVAWCRFSPSMNETGWDVIEVVSNSSYSDNLQAYGSGFLEAGLTTTSIWNSWLSYGPGLNISTDVHEFIMNTDNWVRTQAKISTEDYWQQVSLVLNQFDGMVDGYNQYCLPSQRLTYFQYLLYNLNFEIGDIFTAVGAQTGKDIPLPAQYNMKSHCSSLVKPTTDGQTLFAAHDTWSGYSSMLRTYKHYTFPFAQQATQSISVSFSSYPGNLYSGDDFYITSSNLVVMETTNEVMNRTLYKLYATTETVPYWIRITVANRMASSGEEWSAIFAQYNSGTYNNQWIIVDNKVFTPGVPIQKGTLWICEQIPGYVVSADKSDTLVSQGYWASYNIPYFPLIYNMSGYPAFYQKFGNEFSHNECARAKIFRRDQHNVVDMPTMKTIMRYNEYQLDTLSLQDACRGISARCDLNVPWIQNSLNGFAAFGAIDAKITNNVLATQRTAQAVSGPSWDSQPVFAWTKMWADVPSFGQPRVFDFQFQNMKPSM